MTSNVLTQSSREGETEGVAPRSRSEKRYGVLPVVVSVLGALYLLQAVSPMRVDNDSVVYLKMATSLADGATLDQTGLPPGYPAFIALLDSLGLGHSFVFILANCVFIAMGLAAAQYLFAKPKSGRKSWVVPLTMLAVALIRFVPMPLPESMFFGVSLVAAAVMNAATGTTGARRVSLLCVALVLTIVAITVRLVGFALVPALLWACFHRESRASSPRVAWTWLEKWMATATVLGVAIVAVRVLGDSFRKYSFEAKLMYGHEDQWRQMWGQVLGHLRTIGSVVVNLPWTQFQPYRWDFILAGLVAVVWNLSTVRLRRPRTPAAVYLVSFLALLVLWPYSAQRLWLPIVPLLIGYLESASFRFTPGRKWKAFVRLYVAWFVFAGLGALAYTTRITLSGKDFSKVYGKAGGMSFPDRTTGRVDTLHNHRARELLKRYGNPF
jgi:hypothetical protein